MHCGIFEDLKQKFYRDQNLKNTNLHKLKMNKKTYKDQNLKKYKLKKTKNIFKLKNNNKTCCLKKTLNYLKYVTFIFMLIKNFKFIIL